MKWKNEKGNVGQTWSKTVAVIIVFVASDQQTGMHISISDDCIVYMKNFEEEIETSRTYVFDGQEHDDVDENEYTKFNWVIGKPRVRGVEEASDWGENLI